MQIARATILARACYNTCSDFHMENTGSTDYTITSSSTTSAILFYSTIMCGLILTTTDTCILALYSSMYIRNCFISSNYACCFFFICTHNKTNTYKWKPSRLLSHSPLFESHSSSPKPNKPPQLSSKKITIIQTDCINFAKNAAQKRFSVSICTILFT